jgi:hypothetical protein
MQNITHSEATNSSGLTFRFALENVNQQKKMELCDSFMYDYKRNFPWEPDLERFATTVFESIPLIRFQEVVTGKGVVHDVNLYYLLAEPFNTRFPHYRETPISIESKITVATRFNTALSSAHVYPAVINMKDGQLAWLSYTTYCGLSCLNFLKGLPDSSVPKETDIILLYKEGEDHESTMSDTHSERDYYFYPSAFSSLEAKIEDAGSSEADSNVHYKCLAAEVVFRDLPDRHDSFHHKIAELQATFDDR